jgi:cardiolipin synthase
MGTRIAAGTVYLKRMKQRLPAEREERFYPNNTVKLHRSGEEFFTAIRHMLEAAHEEVYFQTYIFEEDETGRRMADWLAAAARRGVKVYLLADAYGSKRLSDATKRLMEEAGVKLRLFGPLLSRGRVHFGRRLHQKIILCDRRVALVAGINISNNYSGFTGRKPWLDFGVTVEGDVIPALYDICQKTWLGFGARVLRRKHYTKPPSPTTTAGDAAIRPLENDGLRGKYQCAASYLNLLQSATDSVLIVGGYFLPGGRARRAIRKAIRRGVRIRVILAAKSDVGLMHRGMQYLYAWLLRNRVEIYEYRPSNVHGKVLIADEQAVSMGSYDLNNLSTYSNIELNLEIDHRPFARQLAKELDYVIDTQCHSVTMTELGVRYSPWQQFRLWWSYRMLKIMFVLAVWLATKENEQL